MLYLCQTDTGLNGKIALNQLFSGVAVENAKKRLTRLGWASRYRHLAADGGNEILIVPCDLTDFSVFDIVDMERETQAAVV
jgi:hypothetical protein